MDKIILLACSGDNAHLKTFVQNAAYNIYKTSDIREGVIVFGRSVALIDRTLAYNLYVQVCQCLSDQDVPYMTVEIPAKDPVFVGKLLEKDETILKKLNVPYIKFS